MSWAMSQLKEDDLKISVDRLVFDSIWDWTNYFMYAKYALDSASLVKLTPIQKKEAFQLGLILCRGTILTMSREGKPEFNHYNYQFMLGANLICVGARKTDFELVKNLYSELKPAMNECQRTHFLHYFLGHIFESKGKVRRESLELFLGESEEFTLDDKAVKYRIYKLWRCLLGDAPGPRLSAVQRTRLQKLVNGLLGSQTQRQYDRNLENSLTNPPKTLPSIPDPSSPSEEGK
ncbi:MAG: hypothetical protein JST12_03745 [Armatimonadetes bacterium]|nr:hypothetical protein [Armatimonadota bacterium]